jgi:replicative DNA helicase
MDDSIEAAKVILGAILLNCKAAKSVAFEMLRPEDMPSTALAIVFKAALALGADADLVTVSRALTRSGEMVKVGGAGWVAGLTEGLPDLDTRQSRNYCGIVLDGAARRHLERVGQKLSDAAQGIAPAGELAEKAAQYIHKVKERVEARKTMFTGPEIASAVMESYLERRKGKQLGLDFGLPSLDAKVEYGMEPGSFWVVGARPRVGKTTFLTGIIEHHLRAKKKIFHCALEMGLERNAWRLLTHMTGLALARVKNPTNCKKPLDAKEMSRLSAAINDRLGVDNYLMAVMPSASPSEIEAKAVEAEQRMDGLDLIVLDYFQLIRSPQRFNTLREEGAKAVWAIDAMAQRMKVPVLLAAQLNRNAESNKEDELPTLADLKECGTLEEKATGVILLHRWNIDRWDASRSPAKIILAKQQDGGTGVLDMTYNRAVLKWEERDFGMEVTDEQED